MDVAEGGTYQSISLCLISTLESILMLYIIGKKKKLTGMGSGGKAKTGSERKQMNPIIFQRSIINTIAEGVGEKELIRTAYRHRI